MTDTLKLTEAVRGGIRAVNFFNGRLLSGEDLRQEQAAERASRGLLGRAIGAGVAEGLAASAAGVPADLAVTVSPGVAITSQGQALSLGAEKRISLVERPEQNGSGGASGFLACGDRSGGLYVAGEEFHVLVVAPGDYSEGRALVSGTGAAPAGCASHSVVETVVFRLLPLHLSLNRSPSDAGRTRNLAAYALFGQERQRAFLRNPFGALPNPAAAPVGLTPCDVPLALLRIVNGELVYVDPWAVRRAPAPSGGYGPWAALFGPAHDRLAEAVLLQFQLHLAETKPSEVATLKGRERFRFLPPVGVLPAGYTQFFGGLAATKPLPIAPAHVPLLIELARSAPPIDLDSGEAIWRFQVSTGVPNDPGYELFASGFAIDLLGRANLARLNAAEVADSDAQLRER
jgi:hypothetical protein